MDVKQILAVVSCLIALFGPSGAVGGAKPARRALPFPVPAVYVGHSPCGDCGGDPVEILTLRRNGTYTLQTFFRRYAPPSPFKGKWDYDVNGNRIILTTAILRFYRVRNARTLETLGYDGTSTGVASMSRYELDRCSGSSSRRLGQFLKLTCKLGFPPVGYGYAQPSSFRDRTEQTTPATRNEAVNSPVSALPAATRKSRIVMPPYPYVFPELCGCT